MHLRKASCRGGHYGTDQSAAAHGPHEFFPHQWAEAIPCPGWTAQEDAAGKITDLLLALPEHDLEPAGASLQCGWRVSMAISRLLTPDYPGEDDAGIGHQITQLFGVPIAIVAGDERWWRLNAGRRIGGGDVIAEGVMADG
jgi:hypothetical protein